MILKNAAILSEDFTFINRDILIHKNLICEIDENLTDTEELDFSGCYIVPGLIDVHTHGAVGCDAMDGELSSLQKISEYHLKNGVTSFLITTMTGDHDGLLKAMQAADQFINSSAVHSYAHGVNMEGPFLCGAKKGAHPAEFLKNPDIALFDELNAACENNIRLITVAPELDGADELVTHIGRRAFCSIGHTSIGYDKALESFSKGINHVTHLFNAMNPINHREPGLIAAAMEDERVFVELIADGIHIHPAIIRMAFSLFEDRVVLISDSMSAAGMSDGEYSLSGQQVVVKDKKATLSDGTLAGSATPLLDCVRYCVSIGIPLEKALRAATYNPACSIGVDHYTGSIKVGRYADLCVLDRDLNLVRVFSISSPCS